MPDTAIGLMAKFPQIGRVKTRLAANLGPEKALTIYHRLLTHAAGISCDLDEDKYLRAVFCTPAGNVDDFRRLFPEFDRYFPQQGDDLGGRMQSALESLLNTEDINRAFLIGADIPGIDGAIMEKTDRLLDENDLVLGPTVDGGYYLIGLKQVRPELFANITWGTAEVFDRTVDIAGGLGLKLGILPPLRDLDEISDLDHFQEFLTQPK